jgi:hypothetical protein
MELRLFRSCLWFLRYRVVLRLLVGLCTGRSSSLGYWYALLDRLPPLLVDSTVLG